MVAPRPFFNGSPGWVPPLVHASMHCRSMVKCLNLRLFIDRQHHRMRGRSHIKPHDIPQFLHESGILRQFEDAPAMWCKTVGGPPSRACKHALPGNGSAVPLQHRAPRPWPLLARSSASPHAAAVSASGARSRPPCPPEPAPCPEAASCPTEVLQPLPRRSAPASARPSSSTYPLSGIHGMPCRAMVAAMIPCVPTPSALSNTIRARQACF